MTKPFQNIAEQFLEYFGLHGKTFLFFSAAQILALLAKLFTIASLILLTLIVGILAKMVLTHYLILWGDFFIHQIPIVNKIYKAGQDVVKTLFADKSQTFSQVVLVPFPIKGLIVLG